MHAMVPVHLGQKREKEKERGLQSSIFVACLASGVRDKARTLKGPIDGYRT